MERLIKKENIGQVILLLLFSVYLIFQLKLPSGISSTVQTIPGKIIISLIVIYLFMHKHPVLAILGLLVAFDLIRRSDDKQIFIEDTKNNYYPTFNPFPHTLEQEMVKKMTPNVYGGGSLSNTQYKPVLETDINHSSVMN
jgi:hypothetical protein